MRCATQVTPRAFLFRCGTELRYTLGSKARIAQSDRCTRADKRPIRPITPCTSRLRAPCSIPLQKRSRSCMPLASPCPLPPVQLRYYQAAMCTRDSQLQHSNWTTETHTSAQFRNLLRPTALRIQAHRCNLPPRSRSLRGRSPSMPTSCNAETKLLPQRRGGDLALTLRRSVRERCVRCATQVTPRAFLSRCGTELR